MAANLVVAMIGPTPSNFCNRLTTEHRSHIGHGRCCFLLLKAVAYSPVYLVGEAIQFLAMVVRYYPKQTIKEKFLWGQTEIYIHRKL